MILNYNYLKDLKNPQMAIAPVLWTELHTVWSNKLEKDERFKGIILHNISDVANTLGIPYNHNKDPQILKILAKPYDIMFEKGLGESWKGDAILALFRTLVATEDELIRLAEKPSQQVVQEKALTVYFRKLFNKYIREMGRIAKEIKEETYDDLIKNFIKEFIVDMVSSMEYQTKDLERFVKILYFRFHDQKTFKMIGEELNVQHGVINMTIQKVIHDFQTHVVPTIEDRDRFQKKLESMWDAGLINLYGGEEFRQVVDDEDEQAELDNKLSQALDIRNKRLHIITNFIDYFIKSNPIEIPDNVDEIGESDEVEEEEVSAPTNYKISVSNQAPEVASPTPA